MNYEKPESIELNKKLARAHIVCGISQKDLAIKHGCTPQRINQRIHKALEYGDSDMIEVLKMYVDKKTRTQAENLARKRKTCLGYWGVENGK